MTRLGLAVAVGGTLLAVTASPAFGTPTRAEYVAQADPICQAALDRVVNQASAPGNLKGITKPGFDPTVVLARVLGRVNKILKRETTSLASISPPPGDEIAIVGWLDGRRQYARFVDRAIRAGKHGKKRRMLALVKRGARFAHRGALLVTDFGFQYCV